jgi:hypothetical protein
LWQEVPRWAGWKSLPENELSKAPLWCQQLARGVCYNNGDILVKVTCIETIRWPQMCNSGKGHQFPLFGWSLAGLNCIVFCIKCLWTPYDPFLAETWSLQIKYCVQYWHSGNLSNVIGQTKTLFGFLGCDVKFLSKMTLAASFWHGCEVHILVQKGVHRTSYYFDTFSPYNHSGITSSMFLGLV